MLLADILRMLAGLAFTLGLVGLSVVALRRFGPETLRRLQGARAERRITVIESLALDPNRRLLLVRVDAEEHLILLGDGRVLPRSGGPLSGDPRR